MFSYKVKDTINEALFPSTMSSFDNVIENGWKVIEELTTNAYEIQQQILDEIITQNLQTEYLDRFLHGNSAKRVFKDKVPVHSGEPSDIILAEPILELTLSSGTSGGKSKLMPMTSKALDKRTLVKNTLPWSVIYNYVARQQLFLTNNIRTAHLSDWISTDLNCRNAVLLVLKNEVNPRLAESIEAACGGESWEGIIKQLWPGTKYVDVIITGSMAQYVPAFEFYCGGIPLVSTYYAASEGFFGINLEPFSDNISYTLLPNMAFYEFLPIKERHSSSTDVYGHDFMEKQSKEQEIDEPVELLDVKLGQCYEIVVTTFTGLYRYKVGDILKVSGFHNNAPQFHFVGRKGVALSISWEKTAEEDLLKAVAKAKLFIEPFGFMLTDFTSSAHIASTPGHYVLFWELIKTRTTDELPELDAEMMEECCCVVEESLNYLYKVMRNCNDIGPLEIRVVENGSFDGLMEFFISNGCSIGQYKTPRCIRSQDALEMMDSRVIGRYFSKIKKKEEAI